MEQLEFKFEKNFGTYKSAGKVRKVFYKIEKKKRKGKYFWLSTLDFERFEKIRNSG